MSKPKQVITSKCIDHRGEDFEIECTPEKAILYALGIGVSRNPMDKDDLSFTYEKHDDFQVLPTLGTLPF